MYVCFSITKYIDHQGLAIPCSSVQLSNDSYDTVRYYSDWQYIHVGYVSYHYSMMPNHINNHIMYLNHNKIVIIIVIHIYNCVTY